MSGATRLRIPLPLAVLIAVCVLWTLRWSFGVAGDVASGNAGADLTVAAYVGTFLFLILGIPGLVAVMIARLDSTLSHVLTAISLLCLLVGSLASLMWVLASIRMIGGTLSPAQIAGGVLPPVISTVAAVWSRFRLSSESRDIRT